MIHNEERYTDVIHHIQPHTGTYQYETSLECKELHNNGFWLDFSPRRDVIYSVIIYHIKSFSSVLCVLPKPEIFTTCLETFSSTTHDYNRCILNDMIWEMLRQWDPFQWWRWQSWEVESDPPRRRVKQNFTKTARQRKPVANKWTQTHRDIEVRERLADTW